MGVRSDTRDRMIVSAAQLLGAHGYSGTSFAKVLEHSGTPRGSVGHHFPGGKSELVVEALRWAGGTVTHSLDRAVRTGTPPARVFAMICGVYRQQMTGSGYAAGCPVGAVAQEAYDVPEIRAVVAEILTDWTRALARSLTDHGHDSADAADLAELCVASLEGAILMARVQRSATSIDIVKRRLTPLLQPRSGTAISPRAGSPATPGP